MAVKERILEINTLFEGMAECVDYIFEGLSSGNLRALEKAECAMEGGRDLATSLTEAMVRESAEDPGARRYVSIPSHIERMQENMGRIARDVRKQITENILFSDKALNELGYLFERLRDIVVSVREIVGERSPLVAKHIVEAERALERAADDFATKHEERLIEGLCLPGASSLYLGILEAFKHSAWHAREIAKDLEQ